jgi:hypothetical protein
MIISVTKIYSIYNKNTFQSYLMKKNDGVLYSVPLDPANTDYQAIQKWIAEGGVVIDNPPTQENN